MTHLNQSPKNRSQEERLEAALADIQAAHRRAKSEKLCGRVILELSYNEGNLQHWIDEYKRVNR